MVFNARKSKLRANHLMLAYVCIRIAQAPTACDYHRRKRGVTMFYALNLAVAVGAALTGLALGWPL